MPRKTGKGSRGPYRKPVDALKTALEWCDTALKDPEIDPETKEKVAATVFRYETAKMAVERPSKAALAVGKKDQRSEAAKDAAKAAYAPPASPPPPSRLSS